MAMKLQCWVSLQLVVPPWMDVMLGGKDSLLVGALVTWWWEGSWWRWKRRWKCRMGGQLCSATRRTFVCCLAAAVDLWPIPRSYLEERRTLGIKRWCIADGWWDNIPLKETFACVYPGRSWDAGWCACDFVHATVWRKNDLWRSMWWLVRNDTALSLEPSKSSWQNSTKKRERVCKKTGTIESCTDKSHKD